MTATEVLLRFVPDLDSIRASWDDYVIDCQWYADEGKLDPGHPDPGYAQNEPTPWVEYRDECIQSMIDEATGSFTWHRIEPAEVTT